MTTIRMSELESDFITFDRAGTDIGSIKANSNALILNVAAGKTLLVNDAQLDTDFLLSMIREELEAYLDEEKKKACKPSKGKRFAKRVDGKCRSFGQAGKAKGGGDRIRPGTKKGDAYCARSAKIKKCKNPPCANDLSRKKWKCRGSKSMKEGV